MSRVYLGGLNYRAKEKDVEKLVRTFGRVREISLKNGFCFIEFEDRRDADDAVYDLNGSEFMGERLSVEIAKGTPHGRDKERWGTGSSRRGSSPSRSRRYDDSDDERGGRGGRSKPVWMEKYGPPTRTDYRVIVENLSSSVSWQDLKDYMRQAGDVTYADAHRTKRNEGTVEFASYKDMKNAISKLDDKDLNGRRLRLIEDSNNKKRSSRSRSDSRSRSRSRSGSRRKSSRRSRSRSRSRTRSRSRSPIKDKNKGRSKSKRDSRSRTRSRSRSPARRDRSKSRSSTRKSRSRSPIDDKNGSSDKE